MEESPFQSQAEKEMHESDEDYGSGMLSKKLISLILGLIVLVLVVAGGIYVFTKSGASQQVKNQTSKLVSKSTKTTPTPQPINKKQALPTPMTSWKTHQDTISGYSLKYPQNWDVFTRAQDGAAYQIAVYPAGSTDVPLTINSQPNETGVTVDEFITMQYGANYPRETKKIGDQTASFIRNDSAGYTSYFFTKGTNMYEVAVSILKPEYTQILNQIIASLKFGQQSTTKGGN
jgi:hypothetical protein